MHILFVIYVVCDSLLVELRCQIHTELAKCHEDEEQLQPAIDHILKVGYYCYMCQLLLTGACLW